MELSTMGRTWNCLVSGDSISRGVVFDEAKERYLILETNYVALVQEKTRNIVRNVSRFGNTLLRGMGKLSRQIDDEKPDIVLIEYGGNDCDFDWNDIAAHPELAHEPNTGLSLFESTLTASIEDLKGKDIIPVLMTLPPLDADKFIKWVSRSDSGAEGSILKWLGSVTKIYWWQERYSSAITEVAAKTKTRLIDIRGAFLRNADFPGLICKDGIHPNAAGHRVIAQAILDYIASDYSYMLSEAAP
jgi:lysophospholipase L1-like esterase